ncbi:hypothetical protein [Burkholderia contaminans]|uniref:hypothetical protein n=1 Tax=Burkholderia contaminans TaxID=488447 RepID=UPI00128B8083|nr:hypothetical protein [Burkholderia contaminans]MEB4631469.1 hypothetical protein [Burkholderia contaminans]MEB4637683.1 hypothetical protein [Burkholderia contaminans]MEB4652767.1 hypothetical protein [Burkholderia contaminans]MEB4657804.1 hypothetical protein [Burkholderia contaminans]MEB4668045.1 hypothetical protein [Burkholderia contaminans]
MKDRESRCALPSAQSRVSPGSKEARRRQRFKCVGFGHRVSGSRGNAPFQSERGASGSRRMTAPPLARRASDSTVDAAADRLFCLATPKSL